VNGGLDARADALAWSVTAMPDALRRLAWASAAEMPQAIAGATEAVWRVTAVDAALTRRYREYRAQLASRLAEAFTRAWALVAFSAEAGSPADDALRFLASWAATHEPADVPAI
jgi:hypothetical protein